MKNLVSIILILLCTSFIYAQKSKVQQGDWKNLKGITKFNLVFDYSNLEIPKYENEEAFLKDKMQDREEKEQGDGERFRKSWFDDRENRYELKFIESFNKRWDNNEVVVGKNLTDADHIMKIHTTFMYPGYNVGVMRQNSKINAILTVYKKNGPQYGSIRSCLHKS